MRINIETTTIRFVYYNYFEPEGLHIPYDRSLVIYIKFKEEL